MYITFLTWQFRYLLLIGCIKTPAILKYQRVKDSESKETELNDSKHQRLYMRGNKDGEGLNEFKSEGEGEIIG